MGRGRPSIYETRIKPRIKFITPLINAGFSQKDIAFMLDINEDTLYTYKNKYEEFSEAFKKDAVVKRVENTYVNRLTGDYKATKEVYLPNSKGKMELAKIEKYEIPLGERAYAHYLATTNPDKWRVDAEKNVLDITDLFIKAVEQVNNGSAENKSNSENGEQVSK